MRTAGVRLVRPVAVHAVVGEEDGGLGAWATLARGHRGDACVIPEPTAGAVVTANAGALTFRLEVPGRAAHGALRDQGVSAVEVFAELHADLRAFEAERQAGADPALFGTRYPYGLSIGRVEAGDWASSVPDRLVAEGRYGVRLGEPVDGRAGRLRGAGGRLLRRAPVPRRPHPVRVSWTGGSFASGRLPEGHPLLDRVRDAVADAGGGAPPERALSGGTDLRLYAAAGVPALNCGPGDLDLAHGTARVGAGGRGGHRRPRARAAGAALGAASGERPAAGRLRGVGRARRGLPHLAHRVGRRRRGVVGAAPALPRPRPTWPPSWGWSASSPARPPTRTPSGSPPGTTTSSTTPAATTTSR